MKTTMVCRQCQTPVELTRKAARAWTEKAQIPFVCDACLDEQGKQAVVASVIAKAEAQTRVFQALNINPATYESHRQNCHRHTSNS